MNYTSDRLFKIWAYTVSHSFLLLRSSQFFEDVDGYSITNNFNIDVEFWGVSYLNIPDLFEGITIRRNVDTAPQSVLKHCQIGHIVFEIASNKGEHYFIVAAGCRVGKNKWELEDRISNPNLEYDQLLFSF